MQKKLFSILALLLMAVTGVWAQTATWKLTLSSSAKELCVLANNVPIASASLATASTEFTLDVPAGSYQNIAVVASDESNNCYYYTKNEISFTAGQTYQSSPSMTTLDTSSSAAVYKITGTSSATIPAGKTAVLSGVNITNGNITCQGDATIILMGDNSISASSNNAAIQINLMDAYSENYTLTITGTGSLTAQGGDKAAGIGSGNCIESGNIIITGGTIIATCGNNGAGIGSGFCADAKNITITNTVTKVTATKGSGADCSIGYGAIGGMFMGCRVTIGGTNYNDGISTSPYTYIPVSGVTLSQTEAELTLGGEPLTLTATVLPADATVDKSVTWSSDNEAVATVADGVVTAVGAGTCTITVTTTNGAKTATCTVTVAEAAPADPTYNVTFKAGTEDVSNWTATPSSAKKGETVTVKYTGTKKVKSVKAIKK